MSLVQWLLMLHITAAFFFVSGSVAAAILNTMAVRAERPGDAAYLLSLVRRILPMLGLGILGTLVFGIWLWHERGYGIGTAWIWAAVALWITANALGGRGGRCAASPPPERRSDQEQEEQEPPVRHAEADAEPRRVAVAGPALVGVDPLRAGAHQHVRRDGDG